MSRPEGLRTSYAQELALLRHRADKVWLALLAVAAVATPFILDDFWLSVLTFTAIAAIGAIGLNLLTGFTGQVSLGHAFFVGVGAYSAGYLGGNLGLPVIVCSPRPACSARSSASPSGRSRCVSGASTSPSSRSAWCSWASTSSSTCAP